MEIILASRHLYSEALLAYQTNVDFLGLGRTFELSHYLAARMSIFSAGEGRK